MVGVNVSAWTAALLRTSARPMSQPRRRNPACDASTCRRSPRSRSRSALRPRRCCAGKLAPRPLVFPGARGAALQSRNFLRRELYPTMARAKLCRITVHGFRHSGAMLIERHGPADGPARAPTASIDVDVADLRRPPLAGNPAASVTAFDTIVDQWQTDGKRVKLATNKKAPYPCRTVVCGMCREPESNWRHQVFQTSSSLRCHRKVPKSRRTTRILRTLRLL